MKRDIVVIGGSAGSVSALRILLRGLPADLPASVFVVVHVAAETPDLLPAALARDSELPVLSALDHMPLEPARVVVAPPDVHLMFDNGAVRLSHGARENRHRPSIDVLFRSAAACYDGRVIGVVLSGMLDDGAAGLWSIKRRGGLAVVQDPNDAEYPDMPRNAMEVTEVDFALSVGQIAAKLPEWLGQKRAETAEAVPPEVAHEVRMAAEGNPDMKELDQIGKRTPFTCPECGGVLWELGGNGPTRFRCHVGHAYAMHTFAAEQSLRVEAALWAALRTLEEHERIARRLADEAGERGNNRSRKFHQEVATASAGHADVLRQMIAESETSETPDARRPKPGKRR